MNPFIDGYKKFRSEVYAKNPEKYQAMAKTQTSETLFITCADSRVVPGVFTQTIEGDLFQCRVVGNLIPAHGSAAGGVTSAIEYAVMVLKVKHIIVCGHSDCAAMRAFLHPEKMADLHAVRSWIRYAESAIAVAKEQFHHLEGDAFLAALAKENVVSQLNHLVTHPCVASALRRDAIDVWGWYYDIGEGTVEQYDEAKRRFVPLDQLHDG